MSPQPDATADGTVASHRTAEVASLVRAKHWSATPLGPQERWSPGLRAAVELVLASPLGMTVLWGPELIQIYNDGFRAIMGDKHPQGLGQPSFECWPETRHFTSPIYEAVWRGEARSFAEQPVTIVRHGAPEEAWFDLTYSPLRGDAHEGLAPVAGILVTIVEVTGRVLLERRLRDSEARFRAFVTASSDVVYRMSPEWSEMRELDGRGFLASTAGASATWLDRYIHPEDQATVRSAIDLAIAAKVPFELEHRVIRADGTLGWTASRAVPVLTEAGEVAEWLGAASDVTPRRKAEEAQRDGEVRQAFLLMLTDALCPINDPAEAHATAMRLLAQHLGVNRAECFEVDPTGRYVDQRGGYAQGLSPLLGRFDLASFGAGPRESYEAGRPFIVSDTAKLPVSDANRAAYAATGARSAVSVPIFKDGRFTALLAVSDGAPRDWTPVEVDTIGEAAARTWAVVKRLRAEAKLRDNEELFRAFAENSADVIWIASADGTRLEYLSPAFERIFGEPRDAVMRDLRHWRDLVHPDDVEVAADFFPRAAAGETMVAHYRAVHPGNGRIVHLRDTGFPIQDEAGGVRRVAGIVQDVTDIHRAATALQGEKERFRTLAEGIPQLIWRSGDEGLWTWASPQWLAYTGQTREQALGVGWLRAIHPDDHAMTMAAWNEARSHGRLDLEHRVRRAADREWRWHQTRSVPLRAAPERGMVEGGIVEWLGATSDIEELKRLQGQQTILVAELQHRTRNLLAVVRGVARKSLPSSLALDDYDARLTALARVQGFLASTGRYMVSLNDLIEAELQAVGDGRSERVTIEGPAVNLPGEGVQLVALALHELATNAVKYGALAQPEGRLAVGWRVAEQEDRPRLTIVWKESGVTLPEGPPARQGYGSELITRALPYQLGAETRLEFTSDGVRCEITLPPGAFGLMEDAA